MSFADNKLVNATNVTTVASSDRLWANVGGSIRQILVSNFASSITSLVSSGAKRLKIRTETANTAALSTDNVILGDTSGGGFSVTLDTAANMYVAADTDTASITVKQISHTSNTLTVLPGSGNTIDGASSVTLTNDSSATFVSDGSNIHTIYT